MTPETINGLFALGGAALGAILTGAFSHYQSKRNSTRRELSVCSSSPSKLIAVDKMLSDVVEIIINGKKVPTVYIVDAMIANTGNEVVKDIEAQIEWDGDAELVSADLGRTNFSSQENELVVEKVGDLKVRIFAAYLNPGDEVTVRSLFSGRPRKWGAKFRQPGVQLKQRLTDTGIPSVFLRTMFEGIRSNWILHSYFKVALPQYRKYLEAEKRESQDT